MITPAFEAGDRNHTCGWGRLPDCALPSSTIRTIKRWCRATGSRRRPYGIAGTDATKNYVRLTRRPAHHTTSHFTRDAIVYTGMVMKALRGDYKAKEVSGTQIAGTFGTANRKHPLTARQAAPRIERVTHRLIAFSGEGACARCVCRKWSNRHWSWRALCDQQVNAP